MPATTKGEPMRVLITRAKPLASMAELAVTGTAIAAIPRWRAAIVPVTSPGRTAPRASASKGRSASPSALTIASRLVPAAASFSA